MVFMKKPVYPRPRLLAGGAVRTLGLRRALPHNVGAKPRPTDARRTRASASALTMSEKARSGRRLQRLVSRHCAEPRPQFAWL